MRLADPHCHLYFDVYDEDRDLVIERAFQAGLQFIINVGIDAVSNEQAVNLSDVSRKIFSTAGWHPHSADVDPEEAEASVRRFMSHESNVAIGEIGLDYFRNKAPKDKQLSLFRRLARVAAQHKKPIVIHSRDAFEDTMDVLREVHAEYSDLSAVFHCYTYDVRALEAILKMNIMISFTGIVTFESAKALHEVAKEVPFDRFMIETDSPYLTPVPNRGKRNEPAMVRHVAESIAVLRGESVNQVAEWATNNAAQFFSVQI